MKRLLVIMLPLFLCSCNNDGSSVSHQYPAMDSAAFQVFGRQCSLCHAPPLPSTHRAKEWTMVVTRMMRHRAERGLAPLSRQEQATILQYLQQYAAEPI